MKILWLTNIPSPYRVDFFNKLGEQCDLTVLFEKKASSERDKSWNQYTFKSFRGVFLKGISSRVDAAFCPGVLRYIKRGNYDFIVVTNFSSITGILAILHMRRKKIPYYIESDGGFPKNNQGLKEKIKYMVINGAAGLFSTSDMHDDYYAAYGGVRERIYRYPFTSIRECDIVKQAPSFQDKYDLRKKLGIKADQMILSVGQFIPRKGYDVLLRSAAKMERKPGIYIIGGTPTQEYLSLQQKHQLEHVYFLPFKNKQELAKYYGAADLFVLPTREDIWGLVVNEAMAHALPVVTTNKCIAGLTLIQDEKNGIILPVDDSVALAQTLDRLLKNPVLIQEMAQKSHEYIKRYTIEEMAKRHMEIFYGLYKNQKQKVE